MPSSATTGATTIAATDVALSNRLRETLERSYHLGKSPLFVLGAGISADRVPFIDHMAERLVTLIRDSSQIVKPVKAILTKQGESILSHNASRSDAAEFFSTCQLEEVKSGMPQIWSRFCEELAVEGLTSPGGRRFTGLFRLQTEPDPPDGPQPLSGPSFAHLGIASLLTVNACCVLNLNYDPLLFLAMSHLRHCQPVAGVLPDYFHLISLHTDKDIGAYYSSRSSDFQPCVINARGDIFYARCTNDRCPDFGKDRSLDTRYAVHDNDVFRCVSCHLRSIRLQLSFPGYETKERLVQPILHQLRDFLGHRVSVIVPIGLSGQWDPYLLSELFEWSLAYSIPIVDVNPIHELPDGPSAFDRFRRRYFPSIPSSLEKGPCWYAPWTAKADAFMEWLHPVVSGLDAFRQAPKLQKTKPVSRQTVLPLS